MGLLINFAGAKEDIIQVCDTLMWEVDVKAKHKEEEGGITVVLKWLILKKMRDWMKVNNKDYYAIYCVDGTSYVVRKN